METSTAALLIGRESSGRKRLAVRLTSRLHGYAPAVAAIAFGTAVTFLSNATLGPSFPGLFFVWLMVILIGAWCGYGPGLLTVAWVAVAVPFLTRPDFKLDQINPWGIGTLVVVSLIVSRTAVARRQTETRLREINAELDRRVQEKTFALRDANQNLQHRLAEVETLYSKLPVGLCFLDKELRFVKVNQQLAAVNGISAEAHKGAKLRELLPAPLVSAVEPLYRRVLETGVPFADHEIAAEVNGSGLSWWALSCSRVEADDGAVLGLQVIVQDITERKSSEQALKRANEELQRVNADLEQFAYSASHDLQEPLRMVSIYSQMLRKKFGGTLGTEGDQYITYTVTGAKRMEHLVRDLLAYTQASAIDAVVPDFIRAEDCVRDAMEHLQAAIAESGARIEVDPMPQVRMHAVHLSQLFLNLISNALKYRSSDTPFVRVRADEQGETWVFAVSDNGIGIAREYQEQIFGLFKRLHTSSEYSGTGIGLAICQRIVERHGGRIWVESEEGSGSTFRFSLPAAIVRQDLATSV